MKWNHWILNSNNTKSKDDLPPPPTLPVDKSENKDTHLREREKTVCPHDALKSKSY